VEWLHKVAPRHVDHAVAVMQPLIRNPRIDRWAYMTERAPIPNQINSWDEFTATLRACFALSIRAERDVLCDAPADQAKPGFDGAAFLYCRFDQGLLLTLHRIEAAPACFERIALLRHDKSFRFDLSRRWQASALGTGQGRRPSSTSPGIEVGAQIAPITGARRDAHALCLCRDPSTGSPAGSHQLAAGDDLVGKREHRRGHVEAERLGGLEVQHEFELYRRLCGKVGRLFPFEDAIYIGSTAPEDVDGIGRV
jgi:hypothetical protein